MWTAELRPLSVLAGPPQDMARAVATLLRQLFPEGWAGASGGRCQGLDQPTLKGVRKGHRDTRFLCIFSASAEL